MSSECHLKPVSLILPTDLWHRLEYLWFLSKFEKTELACVSKTKAWGGRNWKSKCVNVNMNSWKFVSKTAENTSSSWTWLT